MAEGFVYILTNAAMPQYIKIGLTRQPDVSNRIRQLDNTSAALPFECFYAARVPDCEKLERTLHLVFGETRARQNREFFSANPDLVKAIIELVALEEEIIPDRDQSISPAQREEIERVKRRAERIDLERLGLRVGTTLAFSKDPAVTCVVAGPRRVLFRGREQSLSQAALTAIQEMGYRWRAASGSEYWTYNGTKLSDLRPADQNPPPLPASRHP